MVKKTALIIGIVLMAMYAMAEQQPQTPWVEFENGKYAVATNAENIMIVLPDKPMLTQRLGKYGEIIVDPKTNEKMYNTKNKNIVTPKGLEVYDLLTRIKTDDGFYAFSVVVLEYDKVTIIKYTRTNWNDHIGQITSVFK